jgi:YVTN family beta-propeller protein
LPTAVAVSADGTTAYVTSGYGYTLTVINTATNTVEDVMAKIGVYPFSIALGQ